MSGSAISAYHDPIQGVSVGQNDRASACLSGIFNNRPKQPKYNFIWDVKKVLDFLLTLEYDKNLSLIRLTIKLKHSTAYIFQFGENIKTSTKGKPRNPIKFYTFAENQKLCICHHIDLYRKDTRIP